MLITASLLSFLLILPPQFNSGYWKKLESMFEKENVGLRPTIGKPMYILGEDTWCVIFLLRGENEGSRIKLIMSEGNKMSILIPDGQKFSIEDIASACYVPHVTPPEDIEKVFVVKFTDRNSESEDVYYYVKR